MAARKKALRDAVESGNVECMTDILNDSARINEIFSDLRVGRVCSMFSLRDSALVLASKHGQAKCVEKLLEMSSSIVEGMFSDPQRFMTIRHDLIGALVNAAANDHLECVRLLAELRILRGFEKDDFLYTTFINDVRQHIDDQDYIFDSLKRFSEQDRQSVLKGWKGHNLVSLFMLHKQDIYGLMDEYSNIISVNGWDINGLTPLMMAAVMKDLRAAKYLLSNGANVRTPEASRMDLGTFGSDGTVDYNQPSDDWEQGCGRTALMFASTMLNPPVLGLILDYIPCNVLDECTEMFGMIPLMFAAQAGDVESLSLMFDHGANLGCRDFTGQTALDYATFSDSPDCLEFLLQRAHPAFYISAYQSCIYRDSPPLLSAFLKHYNEPDLIDLYDYTYLMDAIISDCFRSAQVLMDNEHKVDKRNSTGMTALMIACLAGKEEGVVLLVKNGADVNAQSEEGVTPIMFAAGKGRVECVKLLMDFGANLDISDHFKGTVFSAAMSHKGTYSDMLLDVLLDSGQLFDRNVNDGEEKCLKLKSVHRESLNLYRGEIPVSNLISSIRRGLFSFQWTSKTMLRNICFALITCGISPSKFEFQDQNSSVTSLLGFALESGKDWPVIKYLIANLYFLPEDYNCLIKLAAQIRNSSSRTSHEAADSSSVPVSFYEKISSQPLSLKAWSFLHVSKSVSTSSHCSKLADLTPLVNSLPIPKPLKLKLSFNNFCSQLCVKKWNALGSRNETEFYRLADLMFERKLFWKNPTNLRKCSEKQCSCEGLGYTLDN